MTTLQEDQERFREAMLELQRVILAAYTDYLRSISRVLEKVLRRDR